MKKKWMVGCCFFLCLKIQLARQPRQYNAVKTDSINKALGKALPPSSSPKSLVFIARSWFISIAEENPDGIALT